MIARTQTLRVDFDCFVFEHILPLTALHFRYMLLLGVLCLIFIYFFTFQQSQKFAKLPFKKVHTKLLIYSFANIKYLTSTSADNILRLQASSHT